MSDDFAPPSASPARLDRTIHIQLLGRFIVRRPDASIQVSWERPSARRLVALLALAPDRRVSRDRLAELLFPGLGAGPAARSVAKALSMARASLERASGTTVFVADRTTIGLQADVISVDLDAEIERVRRTLELPDHDLVTTFGREPLDARPLLDDDPYEDWAIDARERLERLRTDARSATAHALDRIGAPPEARAGAWRTVAEADPTDEAAWLGLIHAERDSGRPDRALRASYQARAALRETLDVDPGPELEALHQDLVGAAPDAPDGGPGTPRPTFGRASLLAALDRLLGDAVAGSGRDAVLIGPAGIGKTRLLDEAIDLARARGIRVGRGASVPEDRRVPYASLRRALRELPIERIPLKPHLARLLGHGSAPGPATSGRSARDLAMLAEQVIDALTELARDRPIVLVLDDVQWVDPALRTVLQRIVGQRGPRHWAVLTAGRTDDIDALIPVDLGEVIPVPPLDDRAIADLVRATIPEDASATTIAAAIRLSAGNALFAEELARAGPAGPEAERRLPDRIAAVIDRRFAQRSPAARRILPILALGDETVRNDALLAVLGHEQAVLDVLDELTDASLIRRVEGGVRVAHPLIREAAADLVNPIRRSRIHTEYAEALEGLGLDRPEVVLTAVRHRVAAWESGRISSDAGAAAQAAFRGARIVDQEFSIDATRDLLLVGIAAWEASPADQRRALAGAAVPALIRLGEMELDGGDEDAARALFRRALEVGTSDDDRATTWSALGGIPYRRGDLDGAIGAYRDGLAGLADPAGLAAARLRSDLGWSMARAGQPGAIDLLAASAAVLVDRGEPPIASRALDRLATASDDPELALDASDRAFVQLQRGTDRRELGVLLIHRAGIEQRAGRIAAALRTSEEALAIFRAAGDAYMESVCLWNRAVIFDASGDLAAALAARDLELDLLAGIDNPRNLAGCHVHRASLLRRTGRSAEAETAARLAADAAERTGDAGLRGRIHEQIADREAAGLS